MAGRLLQLLSDNRAKLGYLVLAFGVVIGLGLQQKEAHDRCVVGARVIAILHREHVPKLAQYKKQLTRTESYIETHPNGVPSIGLTRQDLLDSLSDLRRQIASERYVINATAPTPCPTL